MSHKDGCRTLFCRTTSNHKGVIVQLCAKHTYGYITKSGRIALKLDKTHYNDAFVIAGGSTEKRATPIKMCQKRRNNRKLERFYDAKYIDLRTVGASDKPKTASGQELSSGRRTRNTACVPLRGKNKSGPNLRIYRGKKVRTIRKEYPSQALSATAFRCS